MRFQRENLANLRKKIYQAMKLYHGSNVEVVTPKLFQSARALDFGRAFYLTSDFDQASRWAKTSVLRRNEGRAIVSVYEFIEGSVV